MEDEVFFVRILCVFLVLMIHHDDWLDALKMNF